MKLRIWVWAVVVTAWPIAASAQDSGARPVAYREMAAAYKSQSTEIEQLRLRLASLEEEVLAPVPEAMYVDDGYPVAHGGCTSGCTGCGEM
mgnify:CR=1 FL=1